jgi:plasmid stabilization system protein ParE
MDTEKSSGLNVVYSAKALKQLDEIWDWNEERYNASHADQYVEFLERHINALSVDDRQGKRVGNRHDLSYVLIRRKSKGHGHIAVFTVDKTQVNVLYIFHSAQDWRKTLADELG